MKKFIAVILSLVMMLSLAACGSSAPAATEAAAPAAAEGTKTFKVAIIQQLDHSSLDEIRNAIEAQLKALAAEAGVAVEISYDNGQNDTSMLTQIATQVVADKPDMIIPIATLAAQYAVLMGLNSVDIGEWNKGSSETYRFPG